MTISNKAIADRIDELADLLEIENANPFRIRAYRNAARMIRGHAQSFADLVARDVDLTELPAIGEALAEKIRALVETGELPALEKAKRHTPIALSTLMKMRGLGPKRVRMLHEKLKVRSLSDLERAARAGRIRHLPGFGEKIEALILAQIGDMKATPRRSTRLEAQAAAQPLVAYLERIKGVKRVEVAGSFRRCKDTVGDLDILATAGRGCPIMDRFTRHEDVAQVLSKGTTRATVRLRSGMQVDLRVVPEVSYGAALHYFTGSKEHNIAVRTLAAKRGLKINEYGVFKDGTRVAGRTEKGLFKAVGLPFIPAELRENRGEIEAGRKGKLPRLVEIGDIRGDLHCHTRASDGHDSIRDMARAAANRGYEYIAIADHSRHVTVAHGLDARRLREQVDEIDRLNDELDDIVVLKSCEVDILENGSLDLPDRVLARLDFALCAVHYKFDLTRRKQTERILRALDNRHVSILAHPSGRLLNERPPYDVDLERIMEAAAERGCALELNANPQRLDLTDEGCLMARELGVAVAIDTDAHSRDQLDFMQLGIDQARRGWLAPQQVLNTRSLEELQKLLER